MSGNIVPPIESTEGISRDAVECFAGESELAGQAIQIAWWIVQKMNLPRDSAEDLAQQGLLKYFQLSWTQRGAIENRRAYLYQIIRNEAASQAYANRHSIVRPVMDDGGEWKAEEFGAFYHQCIEFSILAREVFDQLEPDERSLCEMLVVGYQGSELGFRLGISSEAARQRVSRLRNKLKQRLIENKKRKASVSE